MSWINDLPNNHEKALNELLDQIEQHEDVYENAENSSVAQIWTALAILHEKNQKLERIVKAQRKALRKADIHVNVDKHLDRNLEESLKNY